MSRAVLVLALALVALASGGPAARATVPLSAGELVARSALVVVGKVSAVGDAADGEATIRIVPERLLKGALDPLPAHISFEYRRIGAHVIDFASLRAGQVTQLFYLRFRPDAPYEIDRFHLELADAWFGVEPATAERVREVEALAAPP